MNIQIWGQTAGAALASMLVRVVPFRSVHSPTRWESRSCGWAATAEERWTREGIRTWKYTRCSPSWSFVAIDEETAMLSCSRNANAVL